ncbi:MAG: helix-turn-helix domain-containing protein [Desulfofustis sp.]|nr:helix-turn-helix domain-containing protein [Desulfofustis sp.]RZW26792.1 MAG: AraC family transcriptional regulator [Desulfobulbaceae bacterium]MBT8346584.1 helix-turn-helix domain-containing protein [Desulfofustis sp.]MBT8354350.1 helix-turn-helix domain-containing protein [Desulfofustis sp.]NNF47010.1 AraC family transcriptional regulator [Desulfofustis sp.]
MLGFADLSTFSRSFKRWTWVSPSRYRKIDV